LRQESDRLDAGNNYAIGNTELEDNDNESDHESVSEPEASDSPKSQIQASSPQPKNDDYNPFKGQIAEINLMLAGF
jgi:hypothetical protein